MKAFSLVTTLLALGLIVPAHAAYAFDLDTMIEAAKDGNGTYVETHSSASTGGQTASGGENVQTGDAHASSYTEINAGENGGQVKVKVETTENGETETKEYTQEIPKGEGVKVEATAEAKDGESSSEVKVNGEVLEATNSPVAATTSVVVDFFTDTIPDLFKKVVGFFF
jgi:hypothetical protein